MHSHALRLVDIKKYYKLLFWQYIHTLRLYIAAPSYVIQNNYDNSLLW